MSIFRSGVLGAVQVKCVQPLQDGDFTCEVGKVYNVISQMTNMLMIRNDKGQEILVPKYAFEVVTADPPKPG